MNKILVRKMMSSILSGSGLLTSLEKHFLSDKAFVLLYHRVLNSIDSQELFVQPGMFVAKASFEKQIVFLRDRFNVVFLEDLVEKILNGEDIGGFCAITFDDGWRDNYTEAFPLLKKYRIPATIFLATGFVGTDRIFWPEEISYYLDGNIVNRPASRDTPPSLVRFTEKISQFDRFKREAFLDRCVEMLKRFSSYEREEILKCFRGMVRTEPFPRLMLNWDEAREMLASGLFRFGAHTVNHEIPDQVPVQKAKDEITESCQEIEHRLRRKVMTFAYPNGNHNERIQRDLAECGFNAAVTTRKGFLSRGMPLMEIPRIAIHEDVSSTIPMFRSRILLRKF